MNSLSVDASPYEMYKLLQLMADSGEKVQDNSVGTNGIILCNTKQEKEKATKAMKKLGIKFKNTNINNSEKEPEGNNHSPYPDNGL